MQLSITNLGKQYRRDFWGLKDFSLDAGPGILGLLGANSNGNIRFFLPFSIASIIVALIGRARQLQD